MKKTKKPKVKPLPNKLYKLLRLAVKDAMKVENMKNFTLHMSDWVASSSRGARHCSVCLAGSVMVCELKAHKRPDFVSNVNRAAEAGDTYTIAPENYPDATCKKLFAINHLREGQVFDAYEQLFGKLPKEGSPLEALLEHVGFVIGDDYDSSCDMQRAPWDVYLRAADLLEYLNV